MNVTDPKSPRPASLPRNEGSPPGERLSLPTEDARIAAILAGDRRAAESLLAELLPRVRNLVRYLRRGDQDVDDIAQDALMAILRGLPGWRGEGTFKSWVDRVVAHTTFAHLRKARAAPSPAEDEDDDLGESVPSTDATPEAYVFRRDMVRLLDSLSDEHRQVLVLHHVLGLSVPEMTEELGIPLETVRSRLRIGRANLRALYEGTPGRGKGTP